MRIFPAGATGAIGRFLVPLRPMTREKLARAARAIAPSRTSLALFALIVAAVWTITGLVIRQAYRDTVDRAVAGAANLARSLAEYEASSVRSIDLSLIVLRDEWLRDPASLPAAVQRHADNIAHDLVIQVAVIDASGTIVYSKLPADRRINFADREYFRAHRDSGIDRLHISAPVFGRVTRQWAIQFSRPIRKDGKFAGMIVVAVPPPALEKVYRDIDLGADGVITLARSDGQILARSDNFARGVDVSLAGRPGLGETGPAAASFTGTGIVDGARRFVSYRRLEGYPLTIYVGQSVESVLAGYRSQRNVMLGVAALATLLVYALLRLAESRARDRESRQRLEAALVEGERRLLDERERFMMELHDGSIQSLYAAGLQVETCRRLIGRDPAGAARIAAEVQPQLNRVIQDMRRLLAREEAPGRSPEVFVEELSRLLAARSEIGPRFAFDVDPDAVRSLSAEQASHVLRIAGEAASNVVRHAQARTATVSLKSGGDRVRLVIADDGAGMPPQAASGGGLGLNNIRARADRLGGTLRVDAAPGRGTRVSVEFPAAGP